AVRRVGGLRGVRRLEDLLFPEGCRPAPRRRPPPAHAAPGRIIYCLRTRDAAETVRLGAEPQRGWLPCWTDVPWRCWAATSAKWSSYAPWRQVAPACAW